MERLEEIMEKMPDATSPVNTQTTSSTSQGADTGSSEDAPEVCPLCKGLGYLRADVPVGHPNFGKLFPCRCRAHDLEAERAARLRALGNLGHLARMTFDAFVPEGYGLPPDKARNLRDAFELAHQFAQAPQGWLVLLGGYGSGKTHLAAAIANRCLEHGQPVLFVVVPDLLDHLRATFSPASAVRYDERFDDVRNAPVLILDDLGAQTTSPWAQEKLYQIFNYRYNARLPTVITSNHELEEIDLRLRSRMVDPDLATVHTILAPDFRQSGSARDHSELSSLHLLADKTFESFDLRADELPPEQRENLQHALERAHRFAMQPEGWLVFTGEYGCGKTHLAAAISNQREKQGQPALFVVVPDLLDHLRATFGPASPVTFDKRFEQIRTAPLLVLDDLGTQSASPWAQEKLYQIFNYRYNAQLPTVITTSQKAEEWDPRLRTRMLDLALCTLQHIMVPSYRGAEIRRASRRSRSGPSRRP
jgi:DNA replication protein DnaC